MTWTPNFMIILLPNLQAKASPGINCVTYIDKKPSFYFYYSKFFKVFMMSWSDIGLLDFLDFQPLIPSNFEFIECSKF